MTDAIILPKALAYEFTNDADSSDIYAHYDFLYSVVTGKSWGELTDASEEICRISKDICVIWSDEFYSWPSLFEVGSSMVSAVTLKTKICQWLQEKAYDTDENRCQTKSSSNTATTVEPQYKEDQEARILCSIIGYYFEHPEENEPLLLTGKSPEVDRTFSAPDIDEERTIAPTRISSAEELKAEIAKSKATWSDPEARQWVLDNWHRLESATNIELEFKKVIDDYIVGRGWDKKNRSEKKPVHVEYSGIRRIWRDVNNSIRGDADLKYKFIEYFSDRVVSEKNAGFYVKLHLSCKEEWLGSKAEYHFPVAPNGKIHYEFVNGNEKKMDIFKYERTEQE